MDTNTRKAYTEERAAFLEWANNGTISPILEDCARMAETSGDVPEFLDALNNYEIAARAFLMMTGASFSAEYLGAFDNLEEWGDSRATVRGLIPVWRVRIASGSGSFSVRFRGSLNDGKEGRTECLVYDVLAALVKSEPGEFDDFAQEFGYFPINSANEYAHAVKTWKACRREWRGVCRVWLRESEREMLAAIA